MQSMFFTPLAMLTRFQAIFHLFLIPKGMMGDTVTLTAFKFYEIILGHMNSKSKRFE